MSATPRLMTIHAHPDDEASKGAGTVAKLSAKGVECTLVCCTGGEEGEILNPSMNREGVTRRLNQVRMVELGRSSQLIGYRSVELLGYRDSGMVGSSANDHPDSFHRATSDDAVRELVKVIRRVRPHVMVTYGPDQKAYGHPDHLKVYEISEPAFERAADPAWFPEDGEPWAVQKMYYVVWYLKRMQALHDAVVAAGLESPFPDEWLPHWEEFNHDGDITTFVDVRDHFGARRDSLLAHATQVDPSAKFWFGIPEEIEATVEPFDTYVLACSRVAVTTPEDDLFRGVDVESGSGPTDNRTPA